MEKPANLSINPPSGNKRKDDHEEHTRKLLFELLRQRGIDIDIETGKKIDEKSDIEILLRVIQNEKEKKENQHEISSDNNATIIKSSKPHIQIQLKFFNEFWHLVFN
jgi:organic radical activating enzyme